MGKPLQRINAGFDKFMGRMAGPPSPFLSPQEQEQMLARQRMSMTAALLQGAGPVPRGTSSPLGAFGSAIQAGQQSGDQYTADALRARLMAAQTQGGQDPAKVQEYSFAKQNGYTGSFTDYLNDYYGRQVNRPAHLLEFDALKGMSPEDRDLYFQNLRASQITDVGGVPTRVDPQGGKTPLSTPEAEAAGATRQAEAGAVGAARGAAQATLPAAEQTAQTALETIDSLRNHPGRAAGTGASRMLQQQRVPGTQAYDFEVALQQAKGQVFLNAYQQLKGGGTITEVEGQKAEQAIARMDASQSEESFLDALDDLELIILRGLGTARKRAGQVSATEEPPDFSSMSDEELRQLAGQ